MKFAIIVLSCIATVYLIAGGAVPAKSSLSVEDMAALRGGACVDCYAGWQSTNGNVTGSAGECEHGPEHDNSPACVAARAANKVICKEIYPSTGNCVCFKCQGIPYQDPYSITCENELQFWFAWCGRDTTPNCQEASETCPMEAGAVGPVRQHRPSVVVGGGICSGENGSMGTTARCGVSGPGRTIVYACAANNCQGQGTWGTTLTGTREKCK